MLSLFWGRMTRNGALAGMVTGAVVVIAWKQLAVKAYGSQLYEIVPGFAAATLAIVVVSLLGRVPVQAIRDDHGHVRESLRRPRTCSGEA